MHFNSAKQKVYVEVDKLLNFLPNFFKGFFCVVFETLKCFDTIEHNLLLFKDFKCLRFFNVLPRKYLLFIDCGKSQFHFSFMVNIFSVCLMENILTLRVKKNCSKSSKQLI